jgi:hypothetical protein
VPSRTKSAECGGPRRGSRRRANAARAAAGKPKRETLVTMTLVEQNGKTELAFQGGFEATSSRDAHGEGWSSVFALLREYLPQS